MKSKQLTNLTLTENFNQGVIMNDRQTSEMIMESLNLGELMFELEDASIESEVSMLTILSLAVSSGIRYERCRAEEIRQRKKEKKQKKERNIYNNNNKEKTEKLSNLNTRAQSIQSPMGLSQLSTSPIEAKRQAKEKSKKVDRRVKMPKAWVDAREKETIDDQVLILYGEGQGYDWYSTKELFLAFVDHHLSKGSKFVKWESAFYTWMRNDIKWGNKPATQKGGSVIHSYETKSPIEGLFNED
jgi:hypothetical protein